jgi:hypothetical protein
MYCDTLGAAIQLEGFGFRGCVGPELVENVELEIEPNRFLDLSRCLRRRCAHRGS